MTTDWRRADAGGVDDIRAWCQSVAKPILIVVDTLEKFRPVAKAHAAAYSTDYQAINGLHKLAHEIDVAVVVVHHVRKMEADDPFDMVSGTNGLTGAADTTLVLKKHSDNTTAMLGAGTSKRVRRPATSIRIRAVGVCWARLVRNRDERDNRGDDHQDGRSH